jgi:hypothetical protein
LLPQRSVFIADSELRLVLDEQSCRPDGDEQRRKSEF